MRYVWSMVMAAGIMMAQPGSADAQFSLSIGNPYAGNGIVLGNPGYGYGYNSYSSYGYGPGLYGAPLYGNGLVAPSPYVYRNYGYSSGYRGYGAGPYYGGYRGGHGGYGYRGGNFLPGGFYRGGGWRH